MLRAAQLRPLTAAALRRRALAARSGARRACSSQSDFYVDEAHWPLYGGAVLAVGCLIGGLVVRRESFLRKAQGKVALPPGGIMASEVSVFGLGGLSVAFMLTQLPVDELRVRLLGARELTRNGARPSAYCVLRVTKDGAPLAGRDQEGIAADGKGGFWIANEGNPEKERFHAIYHVDATGALTEEIAIPEELNAQQVRFGFEGITMVGEGDDMTLWMAVQREWKDDDKGDFSLVVEEK